MIRLWKGISFFIALSWLLGSTSPLSYAQETKTFVAYSMKVAQAKVEQAVKQGIDWHKKMSDVFYLGNITKPWAVVLDTETGDWILVGERDPKSSLLTLDDWAAALRARFIHAGEDPGVTIDPRREGGLEAKRQDVRFFGGVEDTHFGQVCYEADWLMKKICFGLERLPVEKLKTYYDLFLEQARNSGAGKSSVASRFWFYPIVNRVNVFGDVVLLEKFQMGVFTEVLSAEVDGKPVADVDQFEHYPSEGFSRSFSENYDAAAEAREVLETLRGLTRLAALAKGLTEVDQKPNVDFYLKGYPLEEVKTPKEVEVLKVENQEAGFKISGGVSLTALAIRLKGGDVSAFREIVLKARKVAGLKALNWEFKMKMRAGQLVGIELPPGLADPAAIADLFTQGWFLYKKKHYQEALDSFDSILRKSSEASVEAWWAQAVVLREYGLSQLLTPDGEDRFRQAISLFKKCIQLKPDFAPAHYELGVTLRAVGDNDQAIATFEHALQLEPDFAEAYYGLGIAYKAQGRHQEAIEAFYRYLKYDDNSSFAQEARRLIAQLEQGWEKRNQHYKDEKKRFSFDYPPQWEALLRNELAAKTKGIIGGDNPDMILAVSNPDDWSQNMNLQILTPPELENQLSEEQLRAFVKQMDQFLPTQFTNFQKISHRIFQFNSVPALEYITTMTLLNRKMQQKQVMFAKHGRAIFITCTAPQEMFDDVDEHYFKVIIESFMVW